MAKIGDFDYFLGLQNRGIGDKSRSLATLKLRPTEFVYYKTEKNWACFLNDVETFVFIGRAPAVKHKQTKNLNSAMVSTSAPP